MFLDDMQRTPETILFAWDYQHEEQFPEFLRSSRRVWLVGMGASYSACLAAVTGFHALGISASAELAATMLHFAAQSVSPEDCVVLVSQSGESAETVRLARVLADRKIQRTLAITNHPESSLAKATATVCDLNSDKDDLVSVITYTATFLVLKKIAFFISQQARPSIDPIVAEARRLFAASEEVASKLVEKIAVPRVVDMLGRGPLLGSAYQAGIVLREITKIPTSVWEAGEFRHGVIESIQPDQLTLLFAVADGPIAPLDSALADRLKRIPGATLVVGASDSELPINAQLDFRPVLDLIVVHHLALRLAQVQDLVPGVFRWAAHVTMDEK